MSVFKVGGNTVLNPAMVAKSLPTHGDDGWFGRCNSIIVPRGRHYGTAHFLVSQSTLESLSLDAPIELSCEHDQGVTSWPDWYCINTQSITQSPESPAHWITLADKRYLLHHRACNKRYNLREDGSGYVTDTTDSGTAYTWEEVLEDLWGTMPSSAGAFPTIPNSPSSTPENLVLDTCNALEAVHRVASMIGLCIAFDPFEGTLTFEEMNAEQDGLQGMKDASRGRKIWDYSPQDLADTNYPSEIAVSFHPIPGEETQGTFLGAPTVKTQSLSVSGMTDRQMPITDTLFKLDSNSAARDTRALELRDAVEGWAKQYAAPWGSIYSGCIEFKLGSGLNEVVWTSDGTRGLRTVAKLVGREPFETVPLKLTGGGGTGGSDNIFAKTPSSGIAACTGSGPYSYGVATCDLFELDQANGNIVDAGDTVVICNSVNVSIAGSVLVQAKKFGSLYFVDAASCAGS